MFNISIEEIKLYNKIEKSSPLKYDLLLNELSPQILENSIRKLKEAYLVNDIDIKRPYPIESPPFVKFINERYLDAINPLNAYLKTAERSGFSCEKIFSGKSKYQKIEMFKCGKDIYLCLNNVVQFHSSDYKITDEYMITIPMCLAENIEKILILGGGTGLSAGEALSFKEVKKIVNVEIDEEIVNLTKKNPFMRELANDSFNNEKVELIIGDALEWVLNSDEKFDVIIWDCDIDATRQSKDFSMQKFTRAMIKSEKMLTRGGVLMSLEPIIDEGINAQIKYFNLTKDINLQEKPLVKILKLFDYFSSGKLFYISKYNSFCLKPALYIYLTTQENTRVFKRNFPETVRHINQNIIDEIKTLS